MRYISVLCDFLFYNMVLFCNVMLLFVICIASTLAADTARFTPCCIGGLCGAIGADDMVTYTPSHNVVEKVVFPGLSL